MGWPTTFSSIDERTPFYIYTVFDDTVLVETTITAIGCEVLDYATAATYRLATTWNLSPVTDWAFITSASLLYNVTSQPSSNISCEIKPISSLPSGQSASSLYYDCWSGTQIETFNVSSSGGNNETIDLNNADIYDQIEARFSQNWAAFGYRATDEDPSSISHAEIENFRLVINYETTGSTSGTLVYNEHWGGTRTLTGNVYVPTGKTLTIWANSTVNLDGYSIESTGGTIAVQSGAYLLQDVRLKNGSTIKGLYPNIQTALNDCGSSDIVWLKATTYNENISIPSSADLKGAGISSTVINGTITMNNVSSASVSDLHVSGDIDIYSGSYNDIENAYVGSYVDMDYGSGHTLENITTGNGYIEIGYTSPLILDLTSTNSATRAITTYGSTFEISTGDIMYKTSRAVDVVYGDPELYDINFCNNTLDIYTGYSGDEVDATDVNYFSTCPAPVGGYGTVNLPASCVSCGGLLKSAPDFGDEELNDKRTIQSQDEGKDEYKEALQILKDINRVKRTERKNGNKVSLGMFADRYAEALALFKSIIATYPNSKYAEKSMSRIFDCYLCLDQETELETYLNNLDEITKNSYVQKEKKRLLVPIKVSQKDYDGAFATLDELFETTDEQEAKYSHLYRKGVIYQKRLNDVDSAVKIYNQIINQASGTSAAFSSEGRLAQLEKEPEPIKEEMQEKEESYKLMNVPNPFNPTTKIQFNIPKETTVKVEVFNSNGQQVQLLTNQRYDAGSHSVSWNASRYSSGIYYYRLTTDDFCATKKMILLK